MESSTEIDRISSVTEDHLSETSKQKNVHHFDYHQSKQNYHHPKRVANNNPRIGRFRNRYNSHNERKIPYLHKNSTGSSADSSSISEAGPSHQFSTGARPKYRGRNSHYFYQHRNYQSSNQGYYTPNNWQHSYSNNSEHFSSATASEEDKNIRQPYQRHNFKSNSNFVQNNPDENTESKKWHNFKSNSNYVQNNPDESTESKKRHSSPKGTQLIYIRNKSPYRKGEPPFYVKHNGTHFQVEAGKLNISSNKEEKSSIKSHKLGFQKKTYYHFQKFDNDETQRGMLTEQLTQNTLECMVCCEIIIREAAIWSCKSCYNIFHLACIKKWAHSSAAVVHGTQNSWRCPACQYIHDKIPYQYRCFCGKIRDPEWNCCDIPHSCGEVCRKKRKDTCPHFCNLLCHPGPCPPCTATIQKPCLCGRTTQVVRCGSVEEIRCSHVCDKLLNCGIHRCKLVCHKGSCPSCTEEIKIVCYCGNSEKNIVCGEATEEERTGYYSCGQLCGKLLLCGNHTCQRICHPGSCEECNLLPAVLTHCPCGQVALADIPNCPSRVSCLDPIPCCDNICGKARTCGPADNRHTCEAKCHEGPCPSCKKSTEIVCRCGALKKEVPCAQLNDKEEFTCERRCQKKRQCGRHKCNKKCCVDTEHKCKTICSRKLSCGLHSCKEACHRGNCQRCWQTSFDELTCFCGATVMYPPIPCGTKPPECNQPCTKEHSCNHPVKHNCHSGRECPPCTYLMEKWCHGNHELRRNIPCYLTEVACGRPCAKPLPCGMHHCLTNCHKGPCPKCSQPCTKPREECGHPCGNPCHMDENCPNTPCKTMVNLTCACGHQSQKVACNVTRTQYQRLTTSVLASKMVEMQLGQSIDIRQLMSLSGKNKLSRLDCNEECALLERNRRLAEALNIENPEVRGKLSPPNYIDFLKDYARLNPSFVLNVEKELMQVVQMANQIKQGVYSHAFPPMNRDCRRFIHELAEFYSCESYSYDQEPKRNVTIIAKRDKSCLPSMLLSAVIQKEKPPKPPPPIPHASNNHVTREFSQESSCHIANKPSLQSSFTTEFGKSKEILNNPDIQLCGKSFHDKDLSSPFSHTYPTSYKNSVKDSNFRIAKGKLKRRSKKIASSAQPDYILPPEEEVSALDNFNSPIVSVGPEIENTNRFSALEDEEPNIYARYPNTKSKSLNQGQERSVARPESAEPNANKKTEAYIDYFDMTE